VALARAAETGSHDPLIRDEYAATLVGTPELAELRDRITSMFRSDGPDDPDSGDADAIDFQQMVDYQAVRTHFFDEYFGAASSIGIRQVVILAAGLDSRAYRLEWPSGTTVFEIDQPKVLAYKAATLDAHGAVPAATRHAVAVDLRDDWPAALIDAGFQPRHATAWLAEGLLPYLPAEAQDRLFEMVTALSAAGSRIAVEAFQPHRERSERLRRQLGLDNDFEALIYQEPNRADAAALLDGHGWQVHGVASRTAMARLGRPVPDDLVDDSADSTLLTAQLIQERQ